MQLHVDWIFTKSTITLIGSKVVGTLHLTTLWPLKTIVLIEFCNYQQSAVLLLHKFVSESEYLSA